MRTSIKTLPKTLMKMLAVASIAGTCVLTSSLTLAQSAQQRPVPSTNQINGNFGTNPVNTNIGQDRPTAPVTAPGSGMAVDGGTAGVVVNNYNSNYNTVTVNK
jgi:hypothetical protein